MIRRIMRKKAVAEIISFVVIALTTIVLVGTAYMWGMPLITKRQDTTKIERVYNYFDENRPSSLVRKIEYVAKNGGTETFVTDTRGLWMLHNYTEPSADNNSIEYITFSKVTNVALGNWSSLTYGSSCPPQEGVVGIDPPLVVCAKSEPFENGFNVIYRTWSRTLRDPTGTKGYKINLVEDPSGKSASNEKIVTISRRAEDVYTCDPPNPDCPDKPLIITKIKILLV